MASFFVVLLLILPLLGCGQRQQVEAYAGATMGTSYHVTVIGNDIPGDLAASIQAVLDDIDGQMSTYKPDSQLMQLNRAPLGQPFPISRQLMAVLLLSEDIYRQTQGAFDPSVGPLVDLWGFGPSYHEDQQPSQDNIDQLRKRLGFDGLALNESALTATRQKDISMDLSAVAKGYAADRVAELLKAEGFSRYMVEIGGEMVLAGVNAKGIPWQIAIEKPVSEAREVEQIVSVSDVGVATSGDYRNYFEHNGQRFSHTIDPRTGYPIRHNLASVTVVADTSGRADALATAFMVMGTEAALDYAEKHAIAILTLTKAGDGFVQAHSTAFQPYLSEVH